MFLFLLVLPNYTLNVTFNKKLFLKMATLTILKINVLRKFADNTHSQGGNFNIRQEASFPSAFFLRLYTCQNRSNLEKRSLLVNGI